MRLMQAPADAARPGGMVAYSLPGMDDQAVIMLSAAGIDPVTLYSLASHHQPGSHGSHGHVDGLIKSLSAVGVEGKLVQGYVPAGDDSADAYKHGEWIEASLPTGARLTVELRPDGIVIKAGDPDEYILPDEQPYIELE